MKFWQLEFIVRSSTLKKFSKNFKLVVARMKLIVLKYRRKLGAKSSKKYGKFLGGNAKCH